MKDQARTATRLATTACVVVCLATLGCASVNGEPEKGGFWRKLPFIGKSADDTSSTTLSAVGVAPNVSNVADHIPKTATKTGRSGVGTGGVVKDDRSFLEGISVPVPRLGPLTIPTNNLAGDDQTLAVGHEIYERAVAAQGAERHRLFDRASAEYAKAASRLKQSHYHEDALFWLGESYFFADKYPKSMAAFGELVKQYPNSRHLDAICQRRFATAQYWLGLKETDGFDKYPNLTNRRRPVVDTFGHAMRQFDRIRFDDPTGKLADDATIAAAVANFKKENYGRADVLFDDLRENFPNSEHQFQAHLLQLECKRKIYDGPDYDGSVLDEAENLVKQLVIQFPNESKAKREYLQKAAGDIRLKKAQREYELAQYYDRRKEFGAARLTYANVATNYKDTNLAAEADAHLARLGGKPDVPEERLQWLADLFPEETNPKPLIASDTLGKIFR